jgi:hypothetical protein
LAKCIEELSLSDSNTNALIAAGLFDVIAVLLQQGQQEVQDRLSQFRYDVKGVKEKCASILLAIAMSDTEHRLLANEECVAAVRSCLQDQGSLSVLTRRTLKGVLLEIKHEQAPPTAAVVPSPTAGNQLGTSVSSSNSGGGDGGGGSGYAMLSYCWNDQTIILRVRESLREAGYACWIDVESMRGSTVDAMADAVEKASIILVRHSSLASRQPSLATSRKPASSLCCGTNVAIVV